MLRGIITARRRGRVSYDERTGAVCDAVCRALARREHDFVTALGRRGPR